ncbi:MAG: hypothetical protein ACLP19_26085 [Xanthobacteraceae bacterium]
MNRERERQIMADAAARERERMAKKAAMMTPLRGVTPREAEPDRTSLFRQPPQLSQAQKDAIAADFARHEAYRAGEIPPEPPSDPYLAAFFRTRRNEPPRRIQNRVVRVSWCGRRTKADE